MIESASKPCYTQKRKKLKRSIKSMRMSRLLSLLTILPFISCVFLPFIDRIYEPCTYADVICSTALWTVPFDLLDWFCIIYFFFSFTKILFCKASSLLEILMRWDYRWDCFLNHLMESAWFKAHQHILSSLPRVFMASVEVKRSSIFSWWFEWKEQQDDDFRIVQKHLNVSYQWSYYYI